METFWQDFRYALRNLQRSWGFTVAALLTLALGIGANTAIFTVAKRVLLDPLPYPEPDRIVVVYESNPELGLTRFSCSPLNFKDFRDRNQTFESMAALVEVSFNMSGKSGQPERLNGYQVTSSYFDVFGIRPLLGRELTIEDDQIGAEKVVVLSHSLWQRRFGGGHDVIGRTIELDSEDFAVVGVMPPGFAETADFFVPLGIEYDQTSRGRRFLEVYGRIAPGVTVKQASTDLKTVAAQLEEAYPSSNTGWSVHTISYQELILEDFPSTMFLLVSAVGLLLLIACANVANLLLIRMALREKEIMLRTALGAGRWRLVRQFLTESTVLALTGGALGLIAAIRATQVLVAMNRNSIPRASHVAIDSVVLLFALGLSLAVAVVFGFLPAWKASRPSPGGSLKEAGRSHAGGLRSNRLRSGLVVAEVAVAVVLLICAGLLLRSLSRLLSVDPGFDPNGALTAQLDLPEAKYGEPGRMVAFYQQLSDRLAGLPGVEAVGEVMPLPLTNVGFVRRFYVEGRSVADHDEAPSSNLRIVNEQYFEAMRIPLEHGRAFTRADGPEALRVVVINKSAAARYFPGKDPLGQRVSFRRPEDGKDIAWMTIVGIVGDVHHEALSVATDPEMYVPYAQSPWSSTTLVIRTPADPKLLAAPLRAILAELDPDIPVYNLRPLRQVVENSVAQSRFSSVLLGLFAVLALLLATIGVYGVISYAVSQRMREIGVRLALGALRVQILGLMLRRGLALVLSGTAIGLVSAFFATRLLRSMIYEVSSTDLATFLTVPLVLGSVGLVAGLVPALRATRIDPVAVLREE